MESEPIWRGNIRMTAQQRRNIREKIIRGGKIADRIHALEKHQHQDFELPAAERTIDQKLRAIQEKPRMRAQKKGLQKVSIWEWIKAIFNFK